ncbi:MAG: class I SAM-dependent methyltransferase [Armatimonadota bacterium]
MGSPNEWQRFFDVHAPHYMDNVFVHGTEREVSFLVEELALQPGQSILDVGCGTGRHCVALARRGFRVTGVDLSAGMLEQARAAALAAGVSVELLQADACSLPFENEFDAAICVCEGSLCLLGSRDDPDEHDIRIFRGVHRALRDGGLFLMTVLNGLRLARKCAPEDIERGRIDLGHMTERIEVEAAPGSEVRINERQRYYVPPELRLLLRCCGFDVISVYGGTAGNWGRRPVDPDEFEIMAVARKCA